MTPTDLAAAANMLRDVVGLLAAETAAPLARAQERLRGMRSGPRADPSDIQALSDDIAAARRASQLGQQIARLSAGTFRKSDEMIDLTAALRQLLADHRIAAVPLPVEFAEQLLPTAVMGDTSLAGTLLQALIAWCSECSMSAVALRLAPRRDAPQALLVCRFVRRPRPPGSPEPLSWHLLRLAAGAMGARLNVESGASTTLAVLFDRLVAPAQRPTSGVTDAIRLAGCQVLVLAPDRDLRSHVRQAIQGLDLIVDYVASVDAARHYCADGLPQAVIYASTLAGSSLDRWRRTLADEHGQMPFIEIAMEGHGFEPLAADDQAGAKVGLDGLARSLPAALAFELSRRR